MRGIAFHFQGARRHQGMSLVEVLVALVVLSVGMLGIAVLFVQSVRNSRSAILRTQAVNLVSDMADRIRANANAQIAYDMSEYSSAPSKHSCAPDDANTDGINCNVEQLAEDDLARWQEAVEDSLPALAENQPASADVRYFPAASSQRPERYRIVVAWREPNEQRNEDTGEPEPLRYQSDVVLMPR